VAYQGDAGAYSEAAAHQLLGTDIEPVGYESFEDCFQSVSNGNADLAMVRFPLTLLLTSPRAILSSL
jgi:prephenate dehydratase